MRVLAASVLAAAGAVAATGALAGSDRGQAPVAHVDPRVYEDTAGGRTGHFLVRLRARPDLELLGRSPASRAEQGRAIVGALRGAAAASQQDVITALAGQGARVRAYWIVNALAVEGTRAAVDAVAGRADVAAVEPDRAFRGLMGDSREAGPSAPRAIEWNVEKVGAPGVWALGHRGEDMVYANADTGVVWDHTALKSRYRGWNGSSATHDYNWWDAIHADVNGDGTNLCGFGLRVPCDDDRGSHGTHTLGTAVGDDGAGNQIGVAPGARWISCRNMDEGVGRPSTYIECLQFFLAPTDLNGASPDPARRPHAIGNSYSCPPSESCAVGSLQQAVDAIRAAGIFISVSAGNEGPNCSTVAFPPAVYDSSVTIGSTDRNDLIASSSSRGPVTADGSGRTKPDLVAPGVSVRSSIREGYGTKSGTSMASPHVGAAALLLWSGFPTLRGNVDRTEQLLEQTAVKLTPATPCGSEVPSQVPNNTYGHGRIDVLAAYRAAGTPTSATAVSAANVAVPEGNRGRTTLTFAVKVSLPAQQPVRIAYRTTPGTARPGADYATASGTLVYAPGEIEKRVHVGVVADRVVERDETFFLRLSAAGSATLPRATPVATIRNDDADRTPPSLTGLSARLVLGRPLVRFMLSEPATVALSLERKGRRVASLSVVGKAGRNSAPVRVRLAAGDYLVRAVPRDRAGNVGAAVRGGAFTVR